MPVLSAPRLVRPSPPRHDSITAHYGISPGVALYRSILSPPPCWPLTCVKYAPCGISPGGGGCPVPVGGQKPLPRFTFAFHYPTTFGVAFPTSISEPSAYHSIHNCRGRIRPGRANFGIYAITRRHKVKRDTRRGRGCGDSLLTRTIKNPWCSSLTRAPLGYFYNAPHWGGGYFEPPPSDLRNYWTDSKNSSGI